MIDTVLEIFDDAILKEVKNQKMQAGHLVSLLTFASTILSIHKVLKIVVTIKVTTLAVKPPLWTENRLQLLIQ